MRKPVYMRFSDLKVDIYGVQNVYKGYVKRK